MASVMFLAIALPLRSDSEWGQSQRLQSNQPVRPWEWMIEVEPQFGSVDHDEAGSIEKFLARLQFGGMEDLKQQLAHTFRAARLRKGLTQEAVADQAGVTTETVSNSERAQSLVTLEVFLRLVAVLDIDLAHIVDAAPARKKMSPKRMRLEGDLAQLGDRMTDGELDLLIRIGKLLRASHGS